MTNQVTFSANVGGDGSTVSDDSSATTGLGNGGFRTRLVPMFTQIIAIANWILGKANAAATSATNAATSETNAGTSASNASTSAAAAAGYAAALTATSTTALAIGTGAKTFTTQTGKQFAAGQFVSIVSNGTPANYMHGQVTSYSGTSLVVNVLDVGGSGSQSDWNISISGTQGATGPAAVLSGTASGAIDEIKGANIASAATVNLEAATGNLVHITGTTTITAITLNSGAERTVVFDGALTLTHNGTSLILPGGTNITTAPGDSMRVRGDGAGNVRVVSYTAASGLPLVAPPASALPYIHVREQQPNGTSGGGSVGAAQQTRVLNTVATNTITGASLGSNLITLPAGTYRVQASAPAYQASVHQASLYNATDSSVLVVGTSEMSVGGNNVQTRSWVVGSFTLSAAKSVSIRHYTGIASSLGNPASDGLGEVYTEVEITKVA
ncbi:hypothetical protein PQR02_04895 [Paraburkholderia sediminicola]|uniref:Uncharacterized protein n=1 Tax=Paraburkholderia rhynchosiae TaxID=487049 RepID=A0ACC7NBJ7_9BURK